MLRQQVVRDKGRGWLDTITEEEPLRPTLGADGTVVGKNGFMHVTSDIAASYKKGIAQQNELAVCTVAAAQTDDHWGGLNEVLCGGYYSSESMEALPSDSIAAEFNSVVDSGEVTVDDERTPADPHGCFDLVAARGIRGARGRAACHCACLTTAQRHSIPPCLDCDDTSELKWDEVKGELEGHELLENEIMMNDSNTPPQTIGIGRRRGSACGPAAMSSSSRALST